MQPAFTVVLLAFAPLFGAFRLSFTTAEDVEPALRGLDPVELAQGKEVAGVATHKIERGAFTYVFADALNMTRFQLEPQRYEIQLGGCCAAMGPLSGTSNPARFAVHDGRIYIFSSDGCRATFQKAPERCIDRDDDALKSTPEEMVRGRELLTRVLQGLGGESNVDAVETYRVVKKDVQKDGDKEHVTRDANVYRFPDGLRRESSWDTWQWFDLLSSEGGYTGKDTLKPTTKEARKELTRQMGRDVLFLARHRNSDGFTFAAGPSETIDGATLDRLLVQYRGATTTLFVEPSTGRVLRASWLGRFGTGTLADIVADFSDFRSVGGVVLPHAREVTMNGKRVSAQSGALESVEINFELSPDAFRRP